MDEASTYALGCHNLPFSCLVHTESPSLSYLYLTLALIVNSVRVTACANQLKPTVISMSPFLRLSAEDWD